MQDALRHWISIHTTPRIVIALLMVVGGILAVAAGCIITLYPDYFDNEPIYFILTMGLCIVGYATHKLQVNALLRELGHVADKGELDR